MRFPLLILLSGGVISGCVDRLAAAEPALRLDLRQQIRAVLRQRLPAYTPPPSGMTMPNHDPEVVTLPPFLVNAPVLRVPSAEDTVRPVIGFVRPVSYSEYAQRDARRQENMRDLLDLAALADHSGDGAVGARVRRETYRALGRDPTPLERAMDKSYNAGRY